jgi:hypothetical protein
MSELNTKCINGDIGPYAVYERNFVGFDVLTAVVMKSYISWDITTRGGGFEYLHRSPASRRRRRKRNPVSGGITGVPCSWGI